MPRLLRILLEEGTKSNTGPTSCFDQIKSLARKDHPTLKHLITLKKIYEEDPHLGGQDASVALQSILGRLFRHSPEAALQMGRMEWDPDTIRWVEFFDEVGEAKMGEYLGIHSHDEIPSTSLFSDEGDEFPESDEEGDGEGDTIGPDDFEPDDDDVEMP